MSGTRARNCGNPQHKIRITLECPVVSFAAGISLNCVWYIMNDMKPCVNRKNKKFSPRALGCKLFVSRDLMAIGTQTD